MSALFGLLFARVDVWSRWDVALTDFATQAKAEAGRAVLLGQFSRIFPSLMSFRSLGTMTALQYPFRFQFRLK